MARILRSFRPEVAGISCLHILDVETTLWDFIETHQLYRVGLTILTPLPGTQFFEECRERIKVFDWSQYDLHHLLWEPRLPVERFFELNCESWRRAVLNARGRKKSWQWLPQVDFHHIGHMARILVRSQRLMNQRAYMAEYKVPVNVEKHNECMVG
jgi:hypothetical protein